MLTAPALRPWLTLRAIRGIGDATFCRLIQTFGSPDKVLSAASDELMESGQVSLSLASIIRRGLDHQIQRAIDHELETLERLGLSVITFLDEIYPSRLRTIHDPPPLLYVSGALEPADHQAVAVVGSRKATPAGRLVTEQLSRELASCGLTVVSGLARGVDAAAHRGALAAKGRTVAVLGCGVDRTYPPEHVSLRKQIESNGAVIAELPLGSPPHGYHFPRRNRIISGMCVGVVVTEATMQSGSLITARIAADQGREVFAVPGFVNAETSRGPNGLIKQGAKLVERVEDILEELLPQFDPALRERVETRLPARTIPTIRPDQHESALYDLVTSDATHIDDLIEKSRLPVGDVSALLLSMELKGLLRQLPGHSYVRI